MKNREVVSLQPLSGATAAGSARREPLVVENGALLCGEQKPNINE